jgi:hypothetical protein
VGYLIFLGVVIGGAAAAVGIASLRRRRGPITPLAFLGTPQGEADAALWLQRLHAEGIWASVRNVRSSSYTLGVCALIYYGEIWVKEQDLERAQETLGLTRMRHADSGQV